MAFIGFSLKDVTPPKILRTTAEGAQGETCGEN